MLNAWSFSRWQAYKSCPLKVKMEKIDKIPAPERPPAASGEHANDRGSRVHDGCEAYVLGRSDELPKEAWSFRDEFDAVKQFAEAGHVEAEHMWGFDQDWKIIDVNPWLRVIIDGFVWLSDTEALVYDIKTGKRRNNEFKHGQQTQLYQLAAFLKYPQLELVHTELWYVDQNEIAYAKYKRNQGLKFFDFFNEEGKKVTSDKEFIATPNRNSCMFCPYGPKESSNKWVQKNGACTYGV